MIDTEDLHFVRDPNDASPPLRNRTDGYRAVEHAEWIYSMHPMTRAEIEAWWISWSVCHLSMKLWILNQRRLRGHGG